MQIQEFTDQEEWVAAGLKLIPQSGKIALSGGTTPTPLYKQLPQSAIYYQVDERYVPAEDKDSNQKMIHDTFAPQNFHNFNTNLPIEECLKKYEEELPENFDLIILGIGEDGHFASLFPHQNPQGKVAHTQTTTHAIKDRLTLTAETILKSKAILVLLKNKPTVLEELKNPTKSSEEFPALKLLNHPNLNILCLKN